MLIAVVAGWSYMQASRLTLAGVEPKWDAVVKVNGAETLWKLVGLRRFENIVLLVDANERVHVLDTSNFVSSTLIKPGATEHRLCDWFGQDCRGTTQAGR